MTDGVQLLYALTSNPFPLQASPVGGPLSECVLTIVASNPSPDAVVLGGIEVTLPIGDGAGALTPDASGVKVVPPHGWSVQSGTGAGVYAFVPDAGTVSVTSQPLTFVLEAIPVNRAPGPVAHLQVAEGSGGTQPPDSPTIDLPLTKFPPGWGKVEFWASDPDIDFGQSTTLNWSGPEGATYEIEYATGAGIVKLPPQGQRFGPVGAYPGPTDPQLELAETTVFTMKVTETIDDVQYRSAVQTTVTVVSPGPQIELFAGGLAASGDGYAATFEWTTSNADHCQLTGVEYLLPTASPPGGYAVAVSPPWGGSYVLEAISGAETASSTLSAAWQTQSVSTVPQGAPPADLALSPDGALLYVSLPPTLLIYTVPASTDQPLPEPAGFQAPYGVESALLAGAGPAPAQSVWASYAYEESLIALLAVENGGLFELGGAGVSVAPTLPAIAATQGGARVYTAVAETVNAYDSDLASNVTLVWTAACPTGAGVAASDDSKLYVAAESVTAYAVSDSGSENLVPSGTLPLDATPTDIAVGGDTLFVALGTEVVVADRGSMQTVGAPVQVAADRIAASPDGLRLYALDIAAGAISVVSPTPLAGGVPG